MGKSLDGILVVALEQAVAAPLCTSRLADAGARVIKVERPGGDFTRHYDDVVHGESAYFVWVNRGKESVTLDLKLAADKKLMERMLEKADVYIQNLATGAAERLGFGSGDWRARRPGLITCDISGYGEDGDYAGMKAYDLLVQAESGLASITGTPDGMARVGFSVCDLCAGMNALAAILEALIARGKTGEGAGITVSLFDGMADWMAVPLLHFDYGGTAPGRVGLHHPSIAPYGAYPYDGGEVLIAVHNDPEWRGFTETVLESPALADDPRFAANSARVANRPALDREITAVFAALGREPLIARLRRARVAYGMINGVAGLSAHPQIRRVTVATPSGPVDLPAPPARTGETPSLGPGPAPGQHTNAIRREFS
ncbi:MAG: CoA transferase [Proteobacteria bacterium]|nr:CoA transferase [Pseudomonadota bacterium]